MVPSAGLYAGFYGVVLYIVLSIAIAFMAARGDRNALLWFFVCIFVTPLMGGILLAASAVTAGRESPPVPISRGTITVETKDWRCPQCAEMNDSDSFVCRHCGYKLT